MTGTYQLPHRQYAQVQYENSKQVNFESVGQDTRYTSKKQLYGNERKCFFCGSSEHLISNCLLKKEKEGNDIHSIETIMSDSIIIYTNALLISKKETVRESNAIKIPLTADIEHK